MRPGPATRAAFYVDSWSRLSPHGGGMTASARQRSKPYRVPHLPEASCGLVTLRSRIHNRAVGQRPCPASCSEELGADWGSRPQRPGQPVRARARFLDSPPAIHPRESPGCRWPCRNHSASSGTLTFRCIHSQPDGCESQHKNPASL